MCMELSTSLSASPDQRLKSMQQEKAVFCRTQLKSPPGQQQCRQYNFQPGLLLVCTWVCALTLGWSVSSRVQGQQIPELTTFCCTQAWNWMHNQGRPGYGVHGSKVPTLPLAAQPLSAFHADLEMWTTVSCLLSQSLLRGKNRFTGASAFCFTGSSVAILIYFDKT